GAGFGFYIARKVAEWQVASQKKSDDLREALSSTERPVSSCRSRNRAGPSACGLEGSLRIRGRLHPALGTPIPQPSRRSRRDDASHNPGTVSFGLLEGRSPWWGFVCGFFLYAVFPRRTCLRHGRCWHRATL